MQKMKGNNEMEKEKEYKAGFSTSLKIATICKLDEFSSTLQTAKSDVARRIIEYFIEHNDIEDLKA